MKPFLGYHDIAAEFGEEVARLCEERTDWPGFQVQDKPWQAQRFPERRGIVVPRAWVEQVLAEDAEMRLKSPSQILEEFQTFGAAVASRNHVQAAKAVMKEFSLGDLLAVLVKTPKGGLNNG